MAAQLPQHGWTAYGRPGVPAPGKPAGNREGICVHEIHTEVAEYRLTYDGIKPELVRYLHGIGEAARD